jgi:hypothetical protein
VERDLKRALSLDFYLAASFFVVLLVSVLSIPDLQQHLRSQIIRPSDSGRLRINRTALRLSSSPIAVGDGSYKDLSGFLTEPSYYARQRLSGAAAARARELGAIRSRIERSFRETKEWRSCADEFRSPNPLWQADVITVCTMLCEWLHFQRHHVPDE